MQLQPSCAQSLNTPFFQKIVHAICCNYIYLGYNIKVSPTIINKKEASIKSYYLPQRH